MDFSALETEVRALIEQDKIREAIDALGRFLTDDTDRNELSLLLANYNSTIQKTTSGVINHLDADIALNNLRANILKFLSAKKEFFKYKNLTFGDSTNKDDSPKDMVKVFFSVASPHNDLQQEYIKELTTYFEFHGIKLETLKNWNEEDPLLAIIDELKEASGCLVLALERYFIQEGKLKRGGNQEHILKEQAFTSPWLQIESALARSLELPLIILKDNGIQNDGLIDLDKQQWGIVKIDHRKKGEIDTYPVKNFILSWIKNVKKFDQERRK